MVVSFVIDSEKSFAGKASSLKATVHEVEGILLLNDEREEKRLLGRLRKLGVGHETVKPILVTRLLGERSHVEPKEPTQIEAIARQAAQELASEASVKAVLYDEPDHAVDQFDLIVIRDKRFQPSPDSYEKPMRNVLLDYHFMDMEYFLRRGDWLKKMKIVYARDEDIRRRVQRKVDLVTKQTSIR